MGCGGAALITGGAASPRRARSHQAPAARGASLPWHRAPQRTMKDVLYEDRRSHQRSCTLLWSPAPGRLVGAGQDLAAAGAHGEVGGAELQKPDTGTSLGLALLSHGHPSIPAGPFLLPGPRAPRGLQPVVTLAVSQALEHKCEKARAGHRSVALEKWRWLWHAYERAASAVPSEASVPGCPLPTPALDHAPPSGDTRGVSRTRRHPADPAPRRLKPDGARRDRAKGELGKEAPCL